MRYFFMTVLSLCCIAALTACGNRTQENETPASSETPEISENVTAEDSTESEAIQGEVSEMRVKLTFDGSEAVVRLADNAAARSFFSQLPITQTFEDFNSIEKICRLPNELSTDNVEKGVDPDIADVTLYTPWNTLVFYYEDYGYNDDLIPMGHVESGMELLAEMGEEFTVTMERLGGGGCGWENAVPCPHIYPFPGDACQIVDDSNTYLVTKMARLDTGVPFKDLYAVFSARDHSDTNYLAAFDGKPYRLVSMSNNAAAAGRYPSFAFPVSE